MEEQPHPVCAQVARCGRSLDELCTLAGIMHLLGAGREARQRKNRGRSSRMSRPSCGCALDLTPFEMPDNTQVAAPPLQIWRGATNAYRQERVAG